MSREQVRSLLIRKAARRFSVPESYCSIDGEIKPWGYGKTWLYAQVAVRGQGSTSVTVTAKELRA